MMVLLHNHPAFTSALWPSLRTSRSVVAKASGKSLSICWRFKSLPPRRHDGAAPQPPRIHQRTVAELEDIAEGKSMKAATSFPNGLSSSSNFVAKCAKIFSCCPSGWSSEDARSANHK